MLEQPTKEQQKEFWEGHGLAILPLDLGHLWWVDKDGNRVHPAYKGNPPIDLNNLFKYAVPKVYDMELIKRNRFEGEWQVAYRARVRLAQKHWQDCITDKDPALALFWALRETMKKK